MGSQVHFASRRQQHRASLSVDGFGEGLQLVPAGGVALLKGSSLAFKSFAATRRSPVRVLSGEEESLPFPVAAGAAASCGFGEELRLLLKGPQRLPGAASAEGWRGTLIRCERAAETGAAPMAVTLAVAEVLAGEEDGGVELLLSCLRDFRAVNACLKLCRFGCGMACAQGFDTCCRSCACSFGAGGGHDGSCAGPASRQLLREAQAVRDFSMHTFVAEAGQPSSARCARGNDAGTSCMICFDEVTTSGAVQLCSKGHVLCRDCLAEHVRTDLMDKGTLPVCPLFTECGHRLTQTQVAAAGPGGAAPIAVLDRFQLLNQRVQLQLLGAVPCIRCEDWLVPDTASRRDQKRGHPGSLSSRSGRASAPQCGGMVECPKCQTRFCRQCRRGPFHFRATCDEVPRIEASWRQWLAVHRDQYIEKRAAEESQFRDALRDFKEKKAEQAKQLQAAEQRAQEFKDMEQWKAARCRRCPRCGRAIEKLAGCDSMTCGQDAHGGNVQNGCGHHFAWSAAPQYHPACDASHLSRPPPPPPAPTERRKMYWEVPGGKVLQCAMCKEAIDGPLFLCIDCYACCSCLKCANGFGAAAGCRHLPESHTFKILWRRRDLRDEDIAVLSEKFLTCWPPRQPSRT